MAPITIYHHPVSPFARSVVFLAKYLKLDAEFKEIDLFAKEQLQDWYVKINPHHTVPYLVDNGFGVSESRAILAYIVNSKKTESTLYPSDPKKRAIIDSRLYFDATTLTVRHSNLTTKVMLGLKDEFDPEAKEKLFEALTWLNDFLKSNKWIAGNDLTIADFSIVGTVTAYFYANAPMDKFPEVKRWFEQMKKIEGFESFSKGAKAYAEIITKNLKKGF